MQGLLERFIVEKYESQLFSNKNIDGIATKMNWDRQTVLSYFTKVLAQKRYNLMQNLGELKRINPDAMEELRQNPEKYLGQMDFDIVNNHNPDISILYDNQIIDVVIDKAT